MALRAPEPPYRAAETVQSTIRTFAENRAFKSPALRNATQPLQLTEPHQVFTLGLTDLVAGKGLEAAKPTGWRYLVQEGDRVLASAETVLAGQGNDHVFSAFNEGRLVAATADAIRIARELPDVNHGDFELRLLSVPGLYFTAVWAHEPQGARDLLLPLTPSFVDAPAGQPVLASRLLDELASKARPASAVGPADRTGG
jgi:hypothetical protein